MRGISESFAPGASPPSFTGFFAANHCSRLVTPLFFGKRADLFVLRERRAIGAPAVELNALVAEDLSEQQRADEVADCQTVEAANFLFKAAAHGLTIGNFIGSLLLQQILGDQGIEFDGRRFEWLGAPVQDENVCALTKASGVTNLDQWFAAKKPVKLGGEAPGANDSDVPRMLQATLKLPIQLIEGYKGTSFIRVAAESGEVDGGVGPGRPFAPPGKRASTPDEVFPVLQINAKKAADIPQVPNAIDFAKSAEAKQLIEAGIHASSAILRAYALPPNTPRERLSILRDAFNATMKDKEFAAEIVKANLDLGPLTGAEVEAIVRKLFQVDQSLVGKLREILVPKK